MWKGFINYILMIVALTQNASGTAEDWSSNPLQKEFPEKCYDLLGCFDTGPPFYDPPQRPVALLPFDMKHISTRFLLFTPSDTEDGHALNFTGDLLTNTTFDPRLETKIIIPGFATFLIKSGLIRRMKDAFLKSGNYNIILVDWSSSNGPPYLQAVANARVVAAQISHLIGALNSSMGVNPNSIHLIGHSLGAHVAGMAGKRIKGLGRISGLDPAGPYFYEAHPSTRLDADDAEFVDVIYTNAGSTYTEGLGLGEAVGHVNFYPNGGSQQPGCNVLSENSSKVDFDPYANGCSHQRVLSLYISSIENTSCRFWAVRCSSFERFVGGGCDRGSTKTDAVAPPLQMGFHALKPPRHSTTRGQKYYLVTDAKPPFCLQRTST